jgi:HEAT repeat protein
MISELQRLDLYRSGLGRQASRFVASGERSDVLDTILALTKAAPRYSAKYFMDHKAFHEAEGNTNVALVTGAFPPGPELARLLSVRIATGSVSGSYVNPPTPAERALNGFSAMVFAGLSGTQIDYSVPWASIISVKTLFAHFRQIGGTMTDLFALILLRNETTFLTEGSWPVSSDFAEYITTYPAAFAEALRKVDPRRRLDAIKLAERHRATSAPEIEALLVAMLTRPFDKNDREIAASALARLDAAQLLALLQRELPAADIEIRFGLVQAAGRNGDRGILALLAERAKSEKAAKVKAAIGAILEAGAADAPAASGADPDAAGYAAIDGSFVALPPLADMGGADAGPASAGDRAAFMRIVEAIVAHRTSLSEESSDRTRFYHRLDDADIDATFELMTQGTRLPPGKTYALVRAIRQREDGRSWYTAYLDRLSVGAALRALMANGHGEMRYLTGADSYIRESERFALDRLGHWIVHHGIGLREIGIADHAAKTGLSVCEAATDPAFDPSPHLREILNQQRMSYDRRSIFQSLRDIDQGAVWPWIADNMDVLDEALGLKPTGKPIPIERGLEALELLPRIPQRYFAKLLDIAVSEKRPLRRRAMALLRDARDLVARIEALLDDKRQQVRSNAAIWLADIRSSASEGALRKRLKKEKSDPVRAALIESLQRLGADLADVIGPTVLIAEAETACAKAEPDLPAWLSGSGLPAVHFRDGSTVPPLVVRHWLALAIRLKDPGATGQFGIYLDQLLPADARSFSNWVLDSWIAYDTQSSTLEDATAYAMANYQQHYSWAYTSLQTPERREELIAHIIREKTGELLNSGSETKGMLALACRADPLFASNRVRWFLKKHGRRSNQAMALLEVLAGTGQPVALQVVIAASARLKQKSTQARAAEIAERYAEDRGWSFDELADRTVPSAGFDDDGVLELPCGEDEKLYTARLDAMLGIHLFNPDGKSMKSLPAGDDEVTKESKKAFSAARKELAQVVELQGSRLFEAMCIERAWPVADWRLAFHEHPVMRRLIERLVWQGLGEEGNPLGLFRPTQEGDFTDAADGAVDIDGFAKIRLAHGALVDEGACRAWAVHLKDYEISPFLAQFDTLRAPLSSEQGEAEFIVDRQGWKADSLTFRGIAEKRGYERVMRDGGGCHEYEKKFPSQGIIATIFHTGSHAIDENNPVALKELRFTKEGHRGAYRLRDVPPVMLAECQADYHAVAAKGVFDPDWEKISPW